MQSAQASGVQYEGLRIREAGAYPVEIRREGVSFPRAQMAHWSRRRRASLERCW